MKFIKTYLIVILLLFALITIAGCEGESHAEGIVISSETNNPLDSVELLCLEDRYTIVVRDSMYTDSLGHFQISNLVMCAPSCPSYSFTFRKNGYETKTIYFKTIHQIGGYENN